MRGRPIHKTCSPYPRSKLTGYHPNEMRHRKTPVGFLIFVFVFLMGGSFGVLSAIAQISTAVSSRQAELQKQLSSLEQEINDQRNILSSKQQESASLERDIAILDAKIKKTQLSIKARSLVIQGLADDIDTKNSVIGELSAKLGREQESLAQLIRQTNEIDSSNLVELALGNQNISSFFSDLDSFRSIKLALKDSFAAIKSNKTETEAQKQALQSKKDEQDQLQNLQIIEQRSIKGQQAEKQYILKVSRGIASVYQKLIVSNEQNAAKIRAELFTLEGSAAIPFGKALELATAAGKATGVRPALILGLVAEESNLGENVGKGNWRVDMKNPRDTEPFQRICSALGLNPDSMPVSKRAWYGYGGAMGPAQFLPSTWVQFQDRIARATGHNPPNPWDPGDAFTAAALYLSDAGAGRGTVSAERIAALRYLAGWANATKSAYSFYGDDVMDLATKYQGQINILQQS